MPMMPMMSTLCSELRILCRQDSSSCKHIICHIFNQCTISLYLGRYANRKTPFSPVGFSIQICPNGLWPKMVIRTAKSVRKSYREQFFTCCVTGRLLITKSSKIHHQILYAIRRHWCQAANLYRSRSSSELDTYRLKLFNLLQ